MAGQLVHLGVAPDQITAEFWIQVLREEGIAAMIRPSDAVSYLGVSAFGCRLLVAEANLVRARQIVESLSADLNVAETF